MKMLQTMQKNYFEIFVQILKKFENSDAALAPPQMALNFELVVRDQLFSVVLASYKWFKIIAPGVRRRHMWQLDIKILNGL